jgi:aerobic carbon-monoxide dehydrogenase large subunit
MLHLGVVRSPHAHARIRGVQTSEAAALPGVAGVYAAADLPEIVKPIPPYRTPRKFRAFEQPVLAASVVRYVGESVAAVLVDDAASLQEAIERVVVDYEPLLAVSSTDAALIPGAPRVHEHWPDNTAYVSRLAVGDVETAFAGAHEVVSERFRHARLAANPIEARGVLAHVEESGELVVVSSTQVTYHLREALAELLGLSQETVRVIAPEVGGAFGAKAQIYSEEILVAALALRLRRPVKWVETRNEHFVATCHDREQVHDIRVGFSRDGKIVAIDDKFSADFGAYPVQDDGVTASTMFHLCSPYRVAHYRNVCANVVTHKTFSAAYRGSGRPEAAFVMDRVMDVAARRLGIDPAEIRRRNFVRPSEMPYRPGLTYKDGAPVAYDVGDFPAAFDELLRLLGYQQMRTLQQQRSRDVRRIGIGLSCYLHATALGPYEGANVRVDPGGRVYVHVGCSSQGQGHATTLAQICAEELGVAFDDVVVVGADTRALPYGIGAMASRIAANSGPAIARAAREVRAKACKVAASLLEAAPEDIWVTQGRVHVVGVPDHGLRLADVAKLAVKSKALMPDPGLNACTYFSPATVTWAFGAQAAVLEVDIETCEIRILKYVAIHDCGRPINPMVVEGQLQGGIVQGIGGALMEQLVYDTDGQLRNASFMDYAMPRADDLPAIETALVNHRSRINELGVKGVGESGCISPAAVIANAVEDGLVEFDVAIREVPLTPGRLFELLRRRREFA